MPGNKNFAKFAFTIPRNVKHGSRDLRLLAYFRSGYELLIASPNVCVCRPLSSMNRENCHESDYIPGVMAGHRG